MLVRNFSIIFWVCAFISALFLVNAWQLELFWGAVILTFIWAAVELNSATVWSLPKSWVLRLMGAFWLLTFISVLHSDILNISVMAFCFVSVLPLSFYIWTISGTEKQFEIAARVLAIIFLGLSLSALAQFFIFGDYFRGRATYPLANPNSLAALFSLAFFCSIGWMQIAKTKIQSNLALGLSVLLFGGIMAAGSRGALLAMLPVLLIYMVVMRAQVRAHWRCFMVLFILSGLLFLLTSTGSEELQNLAPRMAESLTASPSDITNNRLNLWRASWGIIQEYGLFGTGIGTYYLYFPEFRLSDDVAGTFYAHNDPIQYWVELGVLGPVLFYAFMVSVIGRTIMAFKRAEASEQKLKILIPFCAVGACILHTHITFNLYNLSILFIVGFLLAYWFRATQDVLQTPSKSIAFPKRFTPLSRGLTIALPFVFIGILFSGYIASEHLTNKARDNLMIGALEPFADQVSLANKLSFQGNHRTYLLAVNVPLTLLEANIDDLDAAKKQEIFNQGLSYLEHIQKINPRSSSALFYLAKIRELVPESMLPERMKTSQKYYQEAIKIDPLHVGARIKLSHIYEEAGDESAAINILEDGVQYWYTSPNAMNLYSRLAGIYLKNGNTKGRDKALSRMRGFSKTLERRKTQSEKKLYKTIWGE